MGICVISFKTGERAKISSEVTWDRPETTCMDVQVDRSMKEQTLRSLKSGQGALGRGFAPGLSKSLRGWEVPADVNLFVSPIRNKSLFSLSPL